MNHFQDNSTQQSPGRRFRVQQILTQYSVEIAVFGLIVALGIVSRFVMVAEPNFKPIGALVLFAGFYFGRGQLGILAMMLMMMISDMFLGFYEPMMMLAVYGSLAACCGLGWLCRSAIGNANVSGKTFGYFAVSSLLMSCLFFLLTNFAVWASGEWYPTTIEGLSSCFVAAIPFFRNTLASDLMFSQGILAAYGLILLAAKRSELSGSAQPS